MLPNPLIILGTIIAFVAAVSGAYLKGSHDGHKSENASWVILEAKRDKEATDQLLASKDHTRDLEGQLQNLSNLLEHDHAEDQKRLDGLRIANGRLLDDACGMFDKNGRPIPQSGSDGMPQNPGAPRSAQGRPAACELPSQVRALLGELRDDLFAADQAASLAGIGHRYAITIGSILNPPK